MMTDRATKKKMNGCTAEQAWHPEHVKAALRMSGTTQAELARRLGVEKGTIGKAIREAKSKRIERAIARAIGVPAHVIWPDRYPAARRARQEAA